MAIIHLQTKVCYKHRIMNEENQVGKIITDKEEIEALKREKFAELNADAKREAYEEENRRFYD